MREDQLQKAVAKLLDSAGMVWQHTANEANWMGLVRRALIAALGASRGVTVAGRIGAMVGKWNKENGVKSGFPDVTIFNAPINHDGLSDYRGLAIELKVGKNKPTPTQLEWRDKLTGCDWLWVCCYSVDEVLAVLRKHYPHRFTI